MKTRIVLAVCTALLLLASPAYSVDSVIEGLGNDSYNLTYHFGTAPRDGGTINMSGDHEVSVQFNLDNEENDLDTATLLFTIEQGRSGSLNLSSLEIRGSAIQAYDDTALVGDIVGGGRLRPNGTFRLAFAGQEVTLDGNVVEFNVTLRGRARVKPDGSLSINARATGQLDFTEVLAPELTEVHNGLLRGSSVRFVSSDATPEWTLFLQAGIGNDGNTVFEGAMAYGSGYNFLPGGCCGPDYFPKLRRKKNGKYLSTRIPFDESGWVFVELNSDLSISRMKGNVNGRTVNYRWRRSRRK
jgi:hypothetical protein